MSLESPIFGSQKEFHEATKDKLPSQENSSDASKPLEMPKVEASRPVEMEATKPVELNPSSLKDTGLSNGPSLGRIEDFPGKAEPSKRRIGFGNPDIEAKAKPEAAPSPVAQPEATSAETVAPSVEPSPSPTAEQPVVSVNEKTMFGQQEAGRKINFMEMKELSAGDYDLLVEDLKEKADAVKNFGANILKWSGLKLAGRATAKTAEKLVQTAVFAKRVNSYGWWRFGKEASVDAAKYAGKKMVEKGAKFIWEKMKKSESIMKLVNEQIERAAKEAQEKKEKLAATVKQLEDLKAKGIISNFKLKVPVTA